MRFEWMREGPADKCRDHCREWIAATGAIAESTPRDFAAFGKSRDVRGAVIVLNSTGGAVVPGLELGREFRRLGVTTAVGRTMPIGDSGRATLAAQAACNSMCVFLLMGGVKRHVPDAARILVHQIWPSGKRDDANAAVYSAAIMVSTQRTLGEIAQYVVEMGAEIELFRLATRVPPWENLRPLTREELRRLRVHNADEVARALPYAELPAAAPPAATAATGTPAGAALGWTMVERAGGPALVRRHPLTLEGEPIGSFEISFSCTATPGVFAAEYQESRATPKSADKSAEKSSEDARLDAVGISAERERAMLRVESSKPGEPSTQMVSVARGTVSARFIGALGAAAGNQPLIVATSTTGKTRTTIRIGHTGLAESLSRMTAGCPH
jgi:hypothetical protein